MRDGKGSLERNFKISVVIGTYNLKDKLLLVLDSFSKQAFSSEYFEVIVVDSNSSDGTKEAIGKKDYPFRVRFIQQENNGKASARNRGINEAKSDLIVVTDADMIAHPDFLKAHYELQKENNFNVIVQGKTWVLSEEKIPPIAFLRRPYITHKVKHGQRLGFYYCLTGNLCVPKKFFNSFGMFDESFKNYGWEDIDLGYRFIDKEKISLLFNDEAENYHYHVWSAFEELQRKENMGESVHVILAKHPRLKSFLGINFINKFSFLCLNKNIKLVEKWTNQLQQNIRINRFKKHLIREYYYYKGYLRGELWGTYHKKQ